MQNTNVYSSKVANTIGALLGYWDQNQICRFANDAFQVWFGKKSEDLIDKMSLQELLGPIHSKYLQYAEGALEGNIQIFQPDISMPNGNILHGLATYTPDIVNGEVKGIIIHIADITNIKNVEIELTKAKQKAEELATHDYLTGLPNRVLLNDRIASNIQVSERKNNRFAVSIIDIDNFKKINDTYGHLAGDLVLIEIASRAKSALREYDTISRIGGDEFVVLLPEIDKLEQIDDIGNRLLEYSCSSITIQNEAFNPSISLGIAVYPDNGKTIELLLKSADKALYRAKGKGKNCLVFASSLELASFNSSNLT